MKQYRLARFITIFILFAGVIAFAFFYNHSVTTAVTKSAYSDNEILKAFNNEIIKKLVEAPDIEEWSAIIEEYDDVIIVIEDSDNDVVTRSVDRTWTALDVKVQTPFEYKGQAYLVKSSVYLLRDYMTDTRVILRFVFIEFLIGVSGLSVLVFVIYTIMLRPYSLIYHAIEEYDKTGQFKKVNIRGYAGQVYRRFVSVTENLTRQQDNQRRIIASISHDIKTPLTSIMGYSERLKNDSVSPERKERYLDTVYTKSCEIRQLVDEFDEYLSYNLTKELKTEDVAVDDIVRMLKYEYADELENSDIRFEVKNFCNSSTVIAADYSKLKRVFGNIYSNSIKHFDKKDKIIITELYCKGKTVHIDISDNGEGVGEDKLEIIFEPLYTSDEGRKVAGLGLANCREIIEAHGGKIYAGQISDGGLKISIELDRKLK